MPTYEYACRACGEHIEVVQSFRDDPLDTCGACGGVLRKVFSAAGIIFKGSGYYVTDTRTERTAKSGSTSTKERTVSSDSGGASDPSSSSDSAKDSSKKDSSSASGSEGQSTAEKKSA